MSFKQLLIRSVLKALYLVFCIYVIAGAAIWMLGHNVGEQPEQVIHFTITEISP